MSTTKRYSGAFVFVHVQERLGPLSHKHVKCVYMHISENTLVYFICFLCQQTRFTRLHFSLYVLLYDNKLKGVYISYFTAIRLGTDSNSDKL